MVYCNKVKGYGTYGRWYCVGFFLLRTCTDEGSFATVFI